VEQDWVFEIGLTPNRIDSASHYGVARDLAAFFAQSSEVSLKKPSVHPFTVDEKRDDIDVRILNPEACQRYCGLRLSGIQVEESPSWLKNKLSAIGLKPINNIVDITNFVLHECGQPLHAFDAEKIEGSQVKVRKMEPGSTITTLDEEEIELSPDDLVICDREKGMCIAGVLGGIGSGVNGDTKELFLESAYFDAAHVRKTSKRHAIQTDSSFRFERGTDPNNTLYALKRAALLIKEIAGARITSEIIDVYPEKIEAKEITISYERICKLIGKEIGLDRVKRILIALEMSIEREEKNGEMRIKIPTYRTDVEREADVCEEILRIYGYNNVEVSYAMKSAINFKEKPDLEYLHQNISNMLAGLGFNEIMNNSVGRADLYTKENGFDPQKTVVLHNPLSQELNSMRQSLLFGFLDSASRNIRHQNPDMKLFEFGNTYRKQEAPNLEKPLSAYLEEEYLAFCTSGAKKPENWQEKSGPSSYYEIKAYMELILHRMRIDHGKLRQTGELPSYFSYGLALLSDNDPIAQAGAINPGILKNFDIDQELYYCEVAWSKLPVLIDMNEIKVKKLPKYPETRRDLALLLNERVSFEELKNLALQTEGQVLKHVGIFDVYKGKNIARGKKSYALSFIFQDADKTLTDKQVDKIMEKLIKAYQTEFQAEIR
jgi:phenylalanyl-tRNA synthetase beta chain